MFYRGQNTALSVAYSQIESFYWESFARVILEATYESTLYAAILNMKNNNSNTVYLTLVGGVAFGNEEYWILELMQKYYLAFLIKRYYSFHCSQ